MPDGGPSSSCSEGKWFTWHVYIWLRSQSLGFPGGSDSEESTCSARDPVPVPGLGTSPGDWNGYTPVSLPGKSHGQRSLAGCSPWGCKELDTTERLSTPPGCLKTTEIDSCTVLEAETPKSGCLQDCAHSENSRERSFPASCSAFLSLCPSLHMATFPLCVRLCLDSLLPVRTLVTR